MHLMHKLIMKLMQSKRKLLLLTLSVKVMSLMFILTMTLKTDAFDVQVDCQT